MLRRSLALATLALAAHSGAHEARAQVSGETTPPPQAVSEPGSPQEAGPAGEAGSPGEERARRSEIVRLIEAGDYRAARELLDALYVEDSARRAEAQLAAGAPIDAMTSVDGALEVTGLSRAERAGLMLLRGKAAFAAAESRTVDPAMYGEAQENLEEAAGLGAGVGAALRASRAARMLGVQGDALELARAAVQWIDGQDGRAAGLDVDQHYGRTWSEAAFDRFVTVVRSGRTDEATVQERTALAEEVRGALGRVIGDAPTDPWAYAQLGNLALWLGDQDGAVAAAEAGLFASPDDAVMHTAVVTALGNRAEAAARAQGRAEEDVVEARYRAITNRYAELAQKYPEKALFHWYPGYETFFKGAREASLGQDAREIFQDCESMFQRCRELDPSFVDSCVDYEILCRNGRALSLANADETDAAIELLFGVDELRPEYDPAVRERGRVAALEVEFRPHMQSALALLSILIQGLMRDPTDKAALTRAAEIADRQFDLRPKNPNLANNAGFLNRDAAMIWEAEASRVLARAESDEDRARGTALRARAQDLIERSYAAYKVAAALIPDDVRVVNDAGLVMAYYIRTDPERAVEYFEDSIADGERQVAEARALPADALAARGIDLPALVEAWGDAHENMGIVEWTFRRNPEKAREWLGRALEIGPPSRNWMKRQLLPLLDQWIESGERPAALDTLEARTVWTHNSGR